MRSRFIWLPALAALAAPGPSLAAQSPADTVGAWRAVLRRLQVSRAPALDPQQAVVGSLFEVAGELTPRWLDSLASAGLIAAVDSSAGADSTRVRVRLAAPVFASADAAMVFVVRMIRERDGCTVADRHGFTFAVHRSAGRWVAVGPPVGGDAATVGDSLCRARAAQRSGAG